ncbi:MAG TPA: hypothetical protein VHL78_07300, partial [Actinomycetota bacterium]|nr:hypothetical protein [Actinomycetota bacterium]
RAALPDEVIVHSWSSTVIRALEGAGVRAWCARSEPGGEGVRTARRLSASGTAATAVSDEEAVDRAAAGGTVLAGADAVGPGGAINKVGTGTLAAAASAGGGRAFLVVGDAKFVATDLPARRPFERVPLRALTAVITGDGPLDPDAAGRLARRFPLHPLLERELAALR